MVSHRAPAEDVEMPAGRAACVEVADGQVAGGPTAPRGIADVERAALGDG